MIVVEKGGESHAEGTNSDLCCVPAHGLWVSVRQRDQQERLGSGTIPASSRRHAGKRSKVRAGTGYLSKCRPKPSNDRFAGSTIEDNYRHCPIHRCGRRRGDGIPPNIQIGRFQERGDRRSSREWRSDGTSHGTRWLDGLRRGEHRGRNERCTTQMSQGYVEKWDVVASRRIGKR